MKRISLTLAMLLGSTSALAAGSTITCRIPSASFAQDSMIIQVVHPASGPVRGGLGQVRGAWTQAKLTSLGPIGVKVRGRHYLYGFKITQSVPRAQGNACGYVDTEANDTLWADITGATWQRNREKYSLDVDLNNPSASRLTTQGTSDCHGGLSFLSSEGYWQESSSNSELVDCHVTAETL